MVGFSYRLSILNCGCLNEGDYTGVRQVPIIITGGLVSEVDVFQISIQWATCRFLK